MLAARKGGWIAVQSRTLDPGFESQLFHLLTEHFGPGAFLLCPRCVTCKTGTEIPATSLDEPSNICKVLRRVPGTERVLCQCWLLQQTLLLGPARISAVFISSSYPSPLLNVKLTQLSSHSLFIFLHKD